MPKKNYFFVAAVLIVFCLFLPQTINAVKCPPDTITACYTECGGKDLTLGCDTAGCRCKQTPTDPDTDPDSGGTTTDLGSPWEGGPENAQELIENITDWALGIAGSLAVLFIIIAGIRYITSAGNSQLQEGAKKNLTSAIIGLVIVIIAFIIVTAIFHALGVNTTV